MFFKAVKHKMLQLKQYTVRLYQSGSELEIHNKSIKTKDDNLELGSLERIHLSSFNLYATGWTKAEVLKIKTYSGVNLVKPFRGSLETSQEYGLAEGENKRLQFMVTFSENLEISALYQGKWLRCKRIRLLSKSRQVKILFQAVLKILSLFIKEPAAAIAYLRFKDKGAAEKIKSHLRVRKTYVERVLNADIFKVPEQISADSPEVAVIIPVYNAFEELQLCLKCVLNNSDLSYRLIIVEDKSSDARVRPWLRQWVKEQPVKITLLENDTNLGFVKTVNRGLRAAGGSHVVLLNSDAFVPEKWLSRLLGPIFADERVASVTPFSNDAEIFSVPEINQAITLSEGQAEAIDGVAGKLNPGVVNWDVPTGVGFCMAMNARFLALQPQFDEIFERGYGEEVDWCQKAVTRGGRNVVAGNLFVEHRGGLSFGSLNKQQRLEKNNRIINVRYPSYAQQVIDFSRYDPLYEARLLLGLAFYGYERQLEVYLAHSYGGGAEHYLQERIREGVEAGYGVVVLREDEAGYSFELYTDVGKKPIIIGSLEQLKQVLGLVEGRHFIYSTLGGAVDPLGLLETVLAVFKKESDTLTVLGHDYYPLCPSFNLLNYEGRYCAIPDPESCQACYSRLSKTGFGECLTIDEWRRRWKRVLEQCEQIVVFSNDSRRLFLKVYPGLETNIAVQPHQLAVKPKQANRNDDKDYLVIGVPGAIVYHKGAGVLNEIATAIDGVKRRIIVMGDFDPRYFDEKLELHGPYSPEELSALAEHYRLSCWFISSIWPETFSYTTHETLATGLPVFGFDLGAQAEALREAQNGYVLDLMYDNGGEILRKIETIVRPQAV